MPQLPALSLSQTSTNRSTTGELFLIANPCDVLKEHSQIASRFSNQATRHVASFLIPTPKIICSNVGLHLWGPSRCSISLADLRSILTFRIIHFLV
ncbi:hypothetical protein PISMIDRAFT_690041 [Pisolithus microcarpus 441]|uniref:Uncharacterized protein n=1 Tax=Pisolithus microcarpus 441 TaxID=765257 RepID=A0A0C9XHJ1_9AGAM|nr:hypothetical protein PISMIDRAFT_690041 [Pisolithus microcarpus 441]